MARSDRRGQQKHGAGHGAHHREAPGSVSLTEAQQEQLAALVARVPDLAQAIRAAVPEGRDAVQDTLAAVTEADEPVALVFTDRLGELRGAEAQDAADVAQALGELEPRKEVAREARRARLRLRSAGALPSIALPAPAVLPAPAAAAAPAPEAELEPLAFPPLHTLGPRLIEGYATRNREQGEITLILGWQEGGDPNRLRGYILDLSFWQSGVREFARMEPMRRSHFLADTVERITTETKVEVVPVTWAQARRLVHEALAVNEWRGEAPNPEFQRHRKEIDVRLLAEPQTPERQAEVADEERRARAEGDRRYIAKDLEPEEAIANWIGAWSFGDYGLTYDLLAGDHPTRKKETRDEYIALRRQWMGEAEPGGLRMTVVREQAQRASALWVPGAAGALAGERKDVEAFWSLVLHEAPLGGQIDELPMGTLTSAETGRHWFWTGYTLTHDRAAGLWLISRSRDEGATSQALTVEELQRRVREAHESVEQITRQEPPDPRSEKAQEVLQTLTGTLTAALHYADALMVRLPLDETIYRSALQDADSLGNHERAAAIYEKMRGRFADDIQVRFGMGAEQYLTAEQYERQGQIEASEVWIGRAIKTLEGVATDEPTPEHLQALGEILTHSNHFNQAESRLREAIRLDPQRALSYSDLADALMGRVGNENLDEPLPLDAAERKQIARDALAQLREAHRLDSSIPGIFSRMGAIYEVLEQHDDAVLAFEEAVRHDPGDAEAHYTLGSLYLQRRQPEQALPLLETAVQLAPIAIPFRLGLASCYALLNRVPEATRELDLIDRLQPGLPQVAELRSILKGGERRPGRR